MRMVNYNTFWYGKQGCLRNTLATSLNALQYIRIPPNQERDYLAPTKLNFPKPSLCCHEGIPLCIRLAFKDNRS